MGIRRYMVPNTGELPSEKWEVWKVKNKAARFTLIDGLLNKQGF